MKKNWMRTVFSAVLLLGLTTPAFATNGLNNSEQPGSVLVFHKFIRGTNAANGEAKTEIEISATCPKGSVCATSGQTVQLRGHWVCPGDALGICVERDFDLFVTVNGTVVFTPNAPLAPCPRGYLIVWVRNSAGNPIKFDALIGDAVLHDDPASAFNSEFSARAYNAIPIQAGEMIATGSPTDVSPANGALDFNGIEYKYPTGRVFGTVLYEVPGAVVDQIQTDLTLLTLDVISNRPNLRTFVDLNFYNQFETLTSTFTSFICWEEISLSDINPSLTQASQFSRKGLVASEVAVNPNGAPVTLLGIVETFDRTVGGGRDFAYSLYNDGTPVSTRFVP